ncbi:Rab5 GDP/GTP exchange factor [Wickerhamomyces ciferrii]|uniref:Rab5 GDP/GTP exchange factor n=1 Tax=Wickerhamomyces ciferrii (strain ATCC 14091 / BCRC 22168 / CBS 111 / JCM 3599 / NBRC 0793 / NRRL Y-1031 F-60-10) TaxID=1206466 RepID=K0KSS1_WICCF|nr:Rab5 GDP/GTP exchange factor [Wickerhamomyces ciferrii]CCH44414.1 Rab5 GDP/GTP exchange factor [Wickerhamomyces ciferrii]
MFHTPPIKQSFNDESTQESYQDPLRSRSRSLSLLSRKESLSSIHSDNEELPQELPSQLNQFIDGFLKDLKTPRYQKPLTPEQLSDTFQDFYTKFQNKTEVFVKGSVFYKKRVAKIEMLTPVEQEEQNRFEQRIDSKIRRYMEISEEKICIELFDKLFNKFNKDVSTNDYIKKKLKTIQKIPNINYEILLDIQKIDLDSPILFEISNFFNDLNHYKTPYSKLKVLIKIHSSINNFLKAQLNTQFIDGDYFLPLIIFLILINTNDVDFYSNFIYIKRFRQDLLLIEEPLYCLTNFEAAITFIQHLDILNNDDLNYKELDENDIQFLKEKHEFKDENIDIVLPSDGQFLSTSTDGIRLISSAIDNSFKSMIHRFGSANINEQSTTAPPTTTTKSIEEQSLNSGSIDGYNPLNKIVGAMRWRSGSGSGNNTTPTIIEPQNSPPPSQNKQNPSLPIDITKFSNKSSFEDFKISELKELYNDYLVLTKWAGSQTK